MEEELQVATSSSVQANENSNTMSKKLEKNYPYNLFFTEIPDLSETKNQQNSITFTDLLCPSLGELKCTLQINFLLDISWLMEQYEKVGQGKKPITILYGKEITNTKEYLKENKTLNVTPHLVKMNNIFGTHHSKMGIYVYNDDSLRVVVSTANLIREDWNHYCQGLWISPLCPVLPETSSTEDGESATNFKSNLISYLEQYNVDVLKSWIAYIKRADFSNVRVCLITSVPGKYIQTETTHCHLRMVAELLSKHCTLPVEETKNGEGPSSCKIIAQTSSISSLGNDSSDWLCSTFLNSLASYKDSQLSPNNVDELISVIYPTKNNVQESFYGSQGGDCLSYSENKHIKQEWLNNYLHQWKADCTGRSKIIPHIKTYCRISQCWKKLAWFLITSANMTKAAWGYKRSTKVDALSVLSYEVGVLFLPYYFDEKYFQIQNVDDQGKRFPFIYDLPLTPYADTDEPECRVHQG